MQRALRSHIAFENKTNIFKDSMIKNEQNKGIKLNIT